MPRTFLIHLNVEVPDNVPCTAADIAREVTGALEIGQHDEETPLLWLAATCIPLAEEV